MVIYDLQSYPIIAEALFSGRSDGYRLAYLQLRNECGGYLNERQLRTALQRIQLKEGFIRKFLENLYKQFTSMLSAALSWFTGGKNLSELIRSVEKDLPKLREKAKEVERNMETPKLNQRDAEEVFRRLREKIPQPTDDIIQKYVPIQETMRGGDDQVLSFTEFFQKWILLYVVYGVVRSLAGLGSIGLFTGGIGLFGFTVVHLPFLVLLLDDLLDKVGKSDYVVP